MQRLDHLDAWNRDGHNALHLLIEQMRAPNTHHLLPSKQVCLEIVTAVSQDLVDAPSKGARPAAIFFIRTYQYIYIDIYLHMYMQL